MIQKRNNSANVVSIYLFSYHDTVYHTSTNITMFIPCRQNLRIRNILQIFLVIIILYIQYNQIYFIVQSVAYHSNHNQACFVLLTFALHYMILAIMLVYEKDK